MFSFLIFDLDGTLIDSRKDIQKAVNYALSFFSLPPLDIDTVTRYVGDGIEDTMRKALNTEDLEKIDRGVKLFRGYYKNHALDNTAPYEKVHETLEILYQRKKKMAVFTNKPEVFARDILEKMNLAKYFLKIEGPINKEDRKPNPQLLLKMLDEFGAIKEDSLMIGDSKNDIDVARNANIKVCGILFGLTPGEELLELKADYNIRHFSELLDIV